MGSRLGDLLLVISGFLQRLPPGAAYTEWESSAFSSRLEISQIATSDNGTVVAVGDDRLAMSRPPCTGGHSDWIAGHLPITDATRQIDADPDKDGQSTLEEYVAGTSPAIFTTPSIYYRNQFP